MTMAKSRATLHFRIPSYATPRNRWRQLIWQAAWGAARERGIEYCPTDRLAVSIVLYLGEPALALHDVDNRSKDVLDALQGRMGGPKIVRKHRPLIPNDSQVWQVCVTKALPPKQSRALGHVTIRRFAPA